MAGNQIKFNKEKATESMKKLKGSITARRYEKEGRLTPNNRKRREMFDPAYGDITLAGWRQERNAEAKDVSGDSARQDKIAQKNIQRNQSRQGNQEINRKGGGKKLALSSKQRILQAIKTNRK